MPSLWYGGAWSKADGSELAFPPPHHHCEALTWWGIGEEGSRHFFRAFGLLWGRKKRKKKLDTANHVKVQYLLLSATNSNEER